MTGARVLCILAGFVWDSSTGACTTPAMKVLHEAGSTVLALWGHTACSQAYVSSPLLVHLVSVLLDIENMSQQGTGHKCMAACHVTLWGH